MDAPAPPLTVPAFQAKWRDPRLKERSAAQEHFIDLCRLFGAPTPAEGDRTGEGYAFEKGATKLTGGQGFADVWRRGWFAWEYKGPHADLDAAYRQLQLYVDALDNPPLLVVSDLDRFVVRTRFTGTPTETHELTLADLSDPDRLRVLRAVFTAPDELRPRRTTAKVTEEAAERFAALATGMRARGVEAHRAAHFLVQLLFCLFAEDAGLLPKGLFTDLLAYGREAPTEFPAEVGKLLAAMRDGGAVAFKKVPRFNGGLFAEIAPVALTPDELAALAEAAALDWGGIEPAIFGTLFERSLDPRQRAQLGAHYTGRADIERVVEPVVLAPLRRRWAAVRAEADKRRDAWQAATDPGDRTRKRRAFENTLLRFQEELAAVRVLDPACGSGNFLYVALAGLKDLEKQVVAYAAANGLPLLTPRVGPAQLHGLEVNEYARELAQAVVWIGYLQWTRDHGFQPSLDPVLEPLETIRLQDALLDLSDPDHPTEANWPAADFIVGNPPFLGGKRLRAELGDAYTEALHAVFVGRLPPFSDLACYFFEKACAQIAAGRAKRAGLLATNSIRGGANRKVLERIKRSGDIFMAWSDEPWVLDGAAVRISIVGFDDGTETERCLDGRPVAAITSALTGGVDLSRAARLPENAGLSFIGDQPTGPFDVDEARALAWLALPPNPNGRPNADVLRPYWGGADIAERWARRWIVDFGTEMSEAEAALYEAPFEHVRKLVKPTRLASKNAALHKTWWLHWRPRPEMRRALAAACPERFLCTPHVSKHRLFAWLPSSALPNNLLIVFARADDWFFGVLHSRAHEVWSLRLGTSLEDRPRYTPTTCFETFPLPWPPGREPAGDPRVQAVAAAAKALDEKRRAWLDPPGATDPAVLKRRTLTNLYNERPTWLAHLHAALDRAVWAAYGWEGEPGATGDEAILERLLALNRERLPSSAKAMPK